MKASVPVANGAPLITNRTAVLRLQPRTTTTFMKTALPPTMLNRVCLR